MTKKLHLEPKREPHPPGKDWPPTESESCVGRGEADIEDVFGSVDHAKLREVLSRRVRDGVLVRLIGKSLNAGVMEQGQVYRPEAGTPQGGVISPLLANIYLHDALDLWFERDVKPRLPGKATIIRYADDFVVVFEKELDARKFAAVLPKRFEKYGLRLHPEKTRLVEFKRPRTTPDTGGATTGSFDLLDFTHFWGRSLKGKWVVKRATAKARLKRALQRVSTWCHTNRHLPIKQQHERLCQVLRGHDAYFGITGKWARFGVAPSPRDPDLVQVARAALLAVALDVDAHAPDARGSAFASPACRPLRLPSVAKPSPTNRMREMCTSGSAGAPGEKSPGATQTPQCRG